MGPRAAAKWSQVFALCCFLGALGAAPFLDRLTNVFLPLTTLLFLFVCRYAARYLHGDPAQARFCVRLCTAGACVFALILARDLLLFSLAWCATSLSLHQLLEFYSARPGAVLAARKKFLISRLGDACLIGALVLTRQRFHTWDFSRLFAASERLRAAGPRALPAEVTAICILLSLAALMKSAQFPFHTWLPDTMETPTPVSALMHAGIINAGGILVIRLSPLLSLSRAAMTILALFGAFTALFATLVMWTQASVKRCLAFSTVGQMGFMMLECGLGAFHLALLHLVAHSFYKAHAFLSSGGAVMRTAREKRSPLDPFWIVCGIGCAALIAVAAARLTGVPLTDQPLLSAILALAMAQLLWTLWSSSGTIWLIPADTAIGAGFSLAYFALEQGAALIVPPIASGDSVITVPILAAFVLILVAQTQLPALSRTSFGRRLYVHARNGFYFNTLANRLTMAIWPLRDSRAAHFE